MHSPDAAVVIACMRMALAEQERLAGQRLTDARSVGLSLQEETVTEMLLLDLALHPAMRSVARATMFSRTEEGRNGADWLWIFRGRTGGRTLLLVQAKKLHPAGRYALEQASAESQRKSFATQRAVLLAAGRRYGVRTAYALYNPTAAISAVTQPCPTWEAVLGPLGGVALAGAEAVDTAVLGSKRPEDARNMAAVAWPLSCALLCWGHPQWEHGPWPLDVIVTAGLDASGVTAPLADRGSLPDPGLENLADQLSTIASDPDIDPEQQQAVIEGLLTTAGLDGAAILTEENEDDQPPVRG